ncbi:peptide deformylase [Candidatus Shapirobacteria bacterium]|nr:peptide deformylase [Candidatus Shapirobacteria bacterium]
MRKIVTFPNPILRKKSKKVGVWRKEEEGLLTDLKRELAKSKIGVGLSAPQIGVRSRIFIIRCEQEFTVFVNPQITKTFGEKTYPLIITPAGEQEEFLEGCLSFPDLYGPVKRFLKIKAAWQEPPKMKNEKFKIKNKILEGLPAIIFQHELDHLGGILFIDHLQKEKRDLFGPDKEGNKIKIDPGAMLE